MCGLRIYTYYHKGRLLEIMKGRVSLKPNFLKTSMELKWTLQRCVSECLGGGGGWVGGGGQTKSLPLNIFLNLFLTFI